MDALAPIPMLLWCPMCGTRHIDEGEFATKPHHTHACQNPRCGLPWRPAIVPTVGVFTLPGFLNKPAAPSEKVEAVTPAIIAALHGLAPRLADDPKFIEELRIGASKMPLDMKLSLLAAAVGECDADGGCRARRLLSLLGLGHG